jgi:hypothetical protein
MSLKDICILTCVLWGSTGLGVAVCPLPLVAVLRSGNWDGSLGNEGILN